MKILNAVSLPFTYKRSKVTNLRVIICWKYSVSGFRFLNTEPPCTLLVYQSNGSPGLHKSLILIPFHAIAGVNGEDRSPSRKFHIQSRHQGAHRTFALWISVNRYFPNCSNLLCFAFLSQNNQSEFCKLHNGHSPCYGHCFRLENCIR